MKKQKEGNLRAASNRNPHQSQNMMVDSTRYQVAASPTSFRESDRAGMGAFVSLARLFALIRGEPVGFGWLPPATRFSVPFSFTRRMQNIESDMG